MGVPAFFRWLTRKYPSVIVNCIEATSQDVNGETTEIDPSAPNPNGIEFDNLYLDMNGIIHPCTHPEDKPAPKNEDEMMVAIFQAIDRLLNIVRPRKLLYMAIDGVAPRAKMNQQRSRRFRASKESSEKVIEVGKIRAKLETEGAILPPPKEGPHFDSNCITPGTPFMDRLSKCLHYYAHNTLNNNPAWKDLKIILSDANVPGEGEHKVMDFIRKQRAQPNYDPNTIHCLCGADADLIMLGLATHEPHFYIIREEFKPNMDRPCELCGLTGHDVKDCTGLEKNETVVKIFSPEVQFIFVRLSVLREYLRRELDMPSLPFTYDFERAIDDWVFMCFFVGNDFLPHLPSLEIREGAIDRLVNLYKKAVYKTGGFLTENGEVQLSRVQLIMSELGIVEDEIFKKRQRTEEMFRARDKAKRKRIRLQQSREHRPTRVLSGQYAPTALGSESLSIVNPRQEAYQERVQSMQADAAQGPVKRSRDDEESSDEDPHANDEVRLWERGFKDRYYESKFDVLSQNLAFRRKVALEYAIGLCWVLHYYYQGCPSWNWYYPYHYAPFASDFVNIAEEQVVWERGTGPFRPLEQLMSVFPAASREHVPESWAKLMIDPFSPIIDFYPEDFKIDLNGKKFAWQGVALLPFVDEKRLHKALDKVYKELTDEEVRRNLRGDDRLYISESNLSFPLIKDLYDDNRNYDMEVTLQSSGVCGRVLLAVDSVNIGGSLPAPVMGLEVIRENKALCVRFRDAEYGEGHIFSSKRLPEAFDPPSILKPQNLPDEIHRNWKPQIGMVPATQMASLGRAGHRMLGHYANTHQNSPGQYSAVAPPLMQSDGFTGYNHRGRNTYYNHINDRDSNSYNIRHAEYDTRQSNYNNRHQSLFSKQRQADGGSRYASKSEGYSTVDRSETWRLSDRSYNGIAASYHNNADRSQRIIRPSHDYRNANRYQPFDPHSRTGGPRPSGFYRTNDQQHSTQGRGR